MLKYNNPFIIQEKMHIHGLHMRQRCFDKKAII